MGIKTSRRRVLTAAAGLIAVTAFDRALPAYAAPRSRLQRDTDAIRALGVTGVQVRVGSERGPDLVATSGVADVHSGRPVPRHGRFRIASVRKAFIAAVALQLVAEGLLGLDDTVERWLPGVVRGEGNDGGLITIRHLLQNTSGIHDDLPGYYTTPAEYYEHRYEVYTRDELIARAMAHRPDFEPGEAFGYCNTGFLLADAIIERATGRSVREEMTARVLRPLGMRDTSFPGTSPVLPRPHARAYEHFPSGEIVDVTEQVVTDPDSVVSTTADLGRFFRGLLAGRLLSPALLAEMTCTVPVGPELEPFWPGARYGLGLVGRPLPGDRLRWGHDGGEGGYLTVTGVAEDGSRSVVVSMSSSLTDTPEHLLEQQRAADALVDGVLG